MHKLIYGSLFAAVLGVCALPAAARSNVDVFVSFGPPAAYYEPVPPPRVGYVWVPGYWDWRAHRYHWIAGHWVRHRPGYVYHSPRWHHYDGGWRHERGYWRRADYDGDGVPNRWDRFPRNPYRR